MSHSVSIDSSSRFDSSASRHFKELILRRIDQYSPPASDCRSLFLYLQSGHPTLETSAEWVARDPLLTMEVIRSSTCAAAAPLGAKSVQDAVLAIGLERLSRIALRLWMRSISSRSELSLYSQEIGSFTLHALACGSALRFIYYGDAHQSQNAYAIGLLHSIGRIVLDQVFREQGETRRLFYRGTSRRVAQDEMSEFGINNGEVGSIALKRWGFSREIYLPISQQYSNGVPQGHADWRQCLAMARFTADRVMDFLGGQYQSLRSESRAVYREKPLSEIFEYALASVEHEGADILN